MALTSKLKKVRLNAKIFFMADSLVLQFLTNIGGL